MVYVPGLVEGINKGVTGYVGGQMSARQLALQMALRNLAVQKDVSDIDLNHTRAGFYDTLTQRDRQNAQSPADIAHYYTQKYPDLQGQPDAVVELQGKQRDAQAGVGQAPARPAAPSALSALEARRLRTQSRLDIVRADVQGLLDRSPNATSNPNALELQRYVRARYPDVDPNLLNGAVHDVLTARKKGTSGSAGLLQGLTPGAATDTDTSTVATPARETDEGHPDSPSATPQNSEQPTSAPGQTGALRKVTSDQRDYLMALGQWDPNKYVVVDEE